MWNIVSIFDIFFNVYIVFILSMRFFIRVINIFFFGSIFIFFELEIFEGDELYKFCVNLLNYFDINIYKI